MAAAAGSRIDIARVTPMRLAERSCETRGLGRHQDEVDMVRHQAIGPDRDPPLAASRCQKIAIELVIGGVAEQAFATHAALRHEMRQAGNDDAGDASHGPLWHE